MKTNQNVLVAFHKAANLCLAQSRVLFMSGNQWEFVVKT